MDEDALRQELAACNNERALLEEDLALLSARNARTAQIRQIQDAMAKQAAQIRVLQNRLRAETKGRSACAHGAAVSSRPSPCASESTDDDDNDCDQVCPADDDGPCCCRNKPHICKGASSTDNADAAGGCPLAGSGLGSERSYLKEAMADLATRCHSMVRSHCRDIGPFTAGNKDIPRPRADSQSALLMRCAAVETMVAQALVDYVFVDAHRLAATRHPRWRCARKTLLCTGHADDLVEAAVGAVLGGLGVDVFHHYNHHQHHHHRHHDHHSHARCCTEARHRRAALGDALRGFFYDALGLWVSAQQHRPAVQAELAPPGGCWRFADDAHALYGPRHREGRDGEDEDDAVDDMPPFFIVPLFPQIVQYDDGDNGRPSAITTASTANGCRPPWARRPPPSRVLLFHGHALWSQQRSVAQAYREVVREKAKQKARAKLLREAEEEAEAAAEEERERRRWRRRLRRHLV